MTSGQATLARDAERSRAFGNARRRPGGAVMVVGLETWSRSYLCARCKKPMWWSALCYTCATDRPRTVLRPEERA